MTDRTLPKSCEYVEYINSAPLCTIAGLYCLDVSSPPLCPYISPIKISVKKIAECTLRLSQLEGRKNAEKSITLGPDEEVPFGKLERDVKDLEASHNC
ncbi:MAG: hypothetical protein ABSG05_00140 [Candidatus Pacearchaeota archaeon]